MTLLYYEAHVTLDPQEGDRLQTLERLCDRERFRVAKLLMRKDGPAPIDSFTTARSTSLEDIRSRVTRLVISLRQAGFVVRRYKVEDTIVDSKHARGDEWGLL